MILSIQVLKDRLSRNYNSGEVSETKGMVIKMLRVKKITAVISAAVLSATAFCSCSLSFHSSKTPVTIEKKQVEKVERLPGIVCWGSSMAYGAYGEGSSILNSVESHMMADECYIPVARMGVPYESNYTVLSRAGADEIYVKEFIIPETTERVEIKMYTADGNSIFPLRYGTKCDGGMSNVTIAGVEGTLSIDPNSISFEKPIYYFTRNEEGEEVKIKDGEKLISSSMTDYRDYIPVICIGDNGGWKNFKELIAQQQKLINTSTNNDKFIIVGLFSVPLTEEQLNSVEGDEKAKAELIRKNNENYDKLMKKQWGDHYVNAREYLCSNVALEKMEKLELEITTEDKVNMSKGIVPDILRYDPDNLNKYAYDLVGDAVYQRMVELGYLYN